MIGWLVSGPSASAGERVDAGGSIEVGRHVVTFGEPHVGALRYVPVTVRCQGVVVMERLVEPDAPLRLPDGVVDVRTVEEGHCIVAVRRCERRPVHTAGVGRLVAALWSSRQQS